MSISNKARKVAFGSPSGFIAFGFGSGLSPKAPGTFGSLAALPFFLVWVQLPVWAYILTLVLTFGVGVWVCDRSSEALGEHDFGGIVIDEMVGMWITLFLCPLEWLPMLIGFLLFRLFDILKPQPIKWLDQKVSGGFGIMIDDVIAAVFAWLCLQLILRSGWI